MAVAEPVAAAPAAKSQAAAAKPHDAFVAKKAAASAPVAVAKVEAPKSATTHAGPATTQLTADEKAAAASVIGEAPKPPQPEEKKWAMNGKRDPFFSPVVQQPTGSGCSTGKKCLEIGQINLRGVVKSESGFIAVVTNSLNKAYFLHENDPVFNGYRDENHGRFGCVPGDGAGQAGQADHAGSGEADHYTGCLAWAGRRRGSPERRQNRVQKKDTRAGPAVLGRSEMRKQLLSVFLPMLLLGLVASAAETPASQPASQHNELQRVNVVRGADEIRVEISARGAVTPKLSTADSPARLVVDLPGTVMATGQSHITVGSAGVKGVRIGMDGQTPPTTRVVVDLEHALPL